MAVPTTLRKQFNVTSFGMETSPTLVTCKGTAFYIIKQTNKIILSNYDNKNSWILFSGDIHSFATRQAVNAQFAIVDSKFWIFISSNGKALVYEIEPFIDNQFKISRSNILNFNGDIEGIFTNNDIVSYTDIQVIANMKGTNTLRVNVYSDPFNTDGFITYDVVDWTGKNGNDVSMIRERYGEYKTVSIAYTTNT